MRTKQNLLVNLLLIGLMVSGTAHNSHARASSELQPDVDFVSISGANNSVKPPSPFFHLAWKAEITEAANRMAVADTVGDGKLRLILLVEKPQQRGLAILLIKRWNGTDFVTEFTGEVQAAPDRLAVGQFAGPDKPAVIVTADALWSWNGTTYKRSPARKPLDLFGLAKLPNGDERLIISESPTQFKSYRVDTAVSEEWLVDRAEAPTATQVEWESMRASPEFFKKMGMPSFLAGGGLITIWDTTRANIPYIYYCRTAVDVEKSAGGGVPTLDSYIGFRDATEAGGNEVWTTVKLAGLATDLALVDPRTVSPGKKGLLILTNRASAGMARTIYFYSLD